MLICEKKLAVCILTYNRLNYLKKTIDSVIDSKSNDFKMFVFNNHSTDNTNEYLEELEKKNILKEIRFEENLDPFILSNFILENINAKYVIILHDDDTIESEYISEFLDLAERDNEISIVGCAWNSIDENDIKKGSNSYLIFKEPVILSDKEFFWHHVQGLNFTWSGTLIRMDKIKNIRFEFDKFPAFADTIFLRKLTIGNKVGYISKALVNYRLSDFQSSNYFFRKENFVTFYNEWKDIFNFYSKLFKENNYSKKFFIEKKKASTKTMFWLLTISPNYRYYFDILFNFEYFNIFYLKPFNILKVFSKFFKLLFKIEK